VTDLDLLVGPETSDPVVSRRRHVVRVANIVLWATSVAFQSMIAMMNPSILTVVLALSVVLLCLGMNAQVLLLRWAGNRHWRRTVARLHGSAYVSDLNDLPNRNYLLAEIRREMPRARQSGRTFVLVQVSFDTLAEVRERRGNEFGGRAINALAELLKRVTRHSDFVAHLGGPRFVVMLNECTLQHSGIYLQRIPATVAVSDGRHMFEVPLSVRLAEYDMESLYATDVVRDVEEASTLRRRDDVSEQHSWSEAA
jgi:diguanylate cyclase (GGDEF)-like protein